MFTITFLPDSNLHDVSKSIQEYQDIWKTDGQNIVDSWEKTTGYGFKEEYINALVHNFSSKHSHPLCLKSKGSIDEKRAHLVHELGHRVLYESRVCINQKNKILPSSLDNHKLLFLVLYDVYVMLYGQEFANKAVAWDTENLPTLYKESWDFALSFDIKEKRQNKFKQMMVE